MAKGGVRGPDRTEGDGLPRFVDVGYVAELLSVDKATVRRWSLSGELPPPKQIGRTIRWHLGALLAFLESKGPLLAAFANCGILIS